MHPGWRNGHRIPVQPRATATESRVISHLWLHMAQ